MTDPKKAVKAVHDLIATHNDAAEGYAKAAKGVHDPDLSNWLAAASADREHFAADLTDALEEMGEQSRLDLHEGGILHKGWVDLEQRLRSREPHLQSKDDPEIIRECIAGDSGSVGHFDHALAQDLNPDLRSLILRQKATVDDNLVYLQNKVARTQSQTA
jgi:uncharacterized protein (TIGR02284 family)